MTHASPVVRAMAATGGRPLLLARWLFVVAGLVVAMVIVGGITRLTESGLSITEWKPVTGALPPLTHDDWQREFALYRETTQYREVTGPAGMDLAGFQFIFFWEWAHRLLGRLIGLAFALPLALFAVRRWVPRGFGWRLVALLALGGAQGAMGWYMVQSGLAGRTEVSHLRLSAHLMLALVTLGGLVWTALDLRRLAAADRADAMANPADPAAAAPARLTPLALLVLAGLAAQLTLGAWVAGLRAGQVSNSWPLMNDHLVPEGIDWSNGLAHALTHDPYLIHFAHRWWAFGVVALLVVFARAVRPLDRRASIAIHSAFGVQVLLGIATVLSGVELWLAVTHQAVGALLVIATVWGAHVLGRPRSERIAA